MRITKTFDIEMVVDDNIPSDDVEILCQCFSAQIIEYNLKTNNSRPSYVLYRVKEVDKDMVESKHGT